MKLNFKPNLSMKNIKIDLSKFDNSWYKIGKPYIIVIIWYFINILFLKNPMNFSSSLKIFLLKLFGANIGKKVVIKPSVNIKYPWRLIIGNNTWIGENVWIDNLDDVLIGNNCCISQGVLLLCGNHNYKKLTFDLIIGKIVLKDGCWIGANSVVTQNVICENYSILTVNSVASKNMDSNGIYQGNPAVKIRERVFND